MGRRYDMAYAALYCCQCGELRPFQHRKQPCLHCGSCNFTSMLPPWEYVLTNGDKDFLRTMKIVP